MITDKRQLYWLAGLLEGEGSFLAPMPSAPNRPIVRLMMTDEDVVARAAALLDCKYHRIKIKREGAKDAFNIALRGYRAYLLMQALYPLMSTRRKAQIDRALASYAPKRIHKNSAPVVSIE